jgi:iron complex transport system ATP-binding protein
MTAPLLEARGLGYHYGARPVLAGAELSLSAGEVLALLGPNGAGKSTLLRLLAGLVPPAEGEVRLGGVALASLSRRDVARQLALVPQELPVEGGFTALEVALMGRAPHLGTLALDGPGDRALAESALAEVGLAGLGGRTLAQLSGGERRRVLVARALAQQPRVLLLDEPTAFLDLGHQAQLLELCRARAKQGLAVAAVLHDPNLARAYADRVALLAPGQPVVVGHAAELLTRERLSALYGVALTEEPAFLPAR